MTSRKPNFSTQRQSSCIVLYCKIIAMKTTPLVSPLFSERETERPDVQGQCISQSVI